jgi:hypothetical protein
MDRTEYLKLCQRASLKADPGAWWAASWDERELVRWRDGLYVPVDYRFGFQRGEITGVAILHDLKAHAEYHVPLREVEGYQEEENGTESV